nr:MAG TPA: hypothetical protein [Caudoviricetes sp.]
MRGVKYHPDSYNLKKRGIHKFNRLNAATPPQ